MLSTSKHSLLFKHLLIPVDHNLRPRCAENFNLRDALDMPDEFVFVLLSIHFWSRAAAKGLDFRNEH